VKMSADSPRPFFLLAASLAMTNACGQQNFEAERAALVDELRHDSLLAEEYGAPPLSESVLTSIGNIPRHEFVPAEQRSLAYRNHPLPIGAGQTISQPYIVALMTDLADVGKNDIVLEIGTGSGYQAAVLAELAQHVYTIEIIESLGLRAQEDLARLGYDKVTVRIGDGYAGWPEQAPFDAIVVTAAPDEVPQPLIDQLKVGGRMVIPIGRENTIQTLQLLSKDEDGDLEIQNIIPVRFVPLTRDADLAE
jgi:protein-L-isoaspartate(D-aspartate) O-methyltransferase